MHLCWLISSFILSSTISWSKQWNRTLQKPSSSATPFGRSTIYSVLTMWTLGITSARSLWVGEYNSTISCHGAFVDRFIFRSNLLWMRLPWECHNQSQDTNWRHCVTGPELPFFHRRKGVLEIDQSVKMPWHRLSIGVASSCSSAPASAQFTPWNCNLRTLPHHLLKSVISTQISRRAVRKHLSVSASTINEFT